MLTLLGVAVVVAGFALRVHPLVVVLAAALVSGVASGLGPVATLAAIGKAFVDSRSLAVAWLVLPVIGVLERAGLREHAHARVARMAAATPGRVLLAYFVVRQLAASLGLTSLGGHAQMVRPVIAPMVDGAAERRDPTVDDDARQMLRAHAAAVDNVAAFFGEDVFVAFGSILLMKAFLLQRGFDVDAFRFAAWALPTAGLALLVHGARLLLLDRRLARAASRGAR